MLIEEQPTDVRTKWSAVIGMRKNGRSIRVFKLHSLVLELMVRSEAKQRDGLRVRTAE
jgi:hypothetical protein